MSTDEAFCTGLLIVNSDDWGGDRETTDRILELALRRCISSVSAMVFMEDSERAAGIAREHGIDVGLHLNLTTMFSASGCPGRLVKHQQRLARYLRGHRLAQVLFHPGLMSSFQYVVAAQLEEFSRLYGMEPERIDGHHHMHLCANVLLGRLLPGGTMVRRSFSFTPGERSIGNRLYRRAVDCLLARRHRLTDFFFSLHPIEPRERLQRIFFSARRSVVELETHPIKKDEYQFLTGRKICHLPADLRIASRYALPPRR